MSIVLAAKTTKEFQDANEADDTDAAACEHALGGDVPGRRYETLSTVSHHDAREAAGGEDVDLTGVDGVPIPEHLHKRRQIRERGPSQQQLRVSIAYVDFAGNCANIHRIAHCSGRRRQRTAHARLSSHCNACHTARSHT